MGSLSAFHWILVIIVLFLLFGPKRFADASKGLAKGLRGFKEELRKAGDDQHVGDEKASERLPPANADAPSASPRTDRKHDVRMQH
jgi:sec-independent protein translocase protein TatA